MRFNQVSMMALASVDAPHRISSASLEDRLSATMRRLQIPDGLIVGLSGIIERRFWDPGMQIGDAASLAANKVLEESGLDRKKVGALISTSVGRDYLEPSVACLVHGDIGMPESCMNFDLANACLGFINGMDMVANMIELGQIDYGMVVNGESARAISDNTIALLSDPDCDEESFRSNFASLTMGSGAAAMILARSDLAPDGHRYLGGVHLASTGDGDNRLCYGSNEGICTDTKQLMISGLRLAGRTWQRAVEKLDWSPDALNHFVMHQVSKAHMSKFCEMLGLNEDKFFRLYPEFGNVGPASVPIALDKLDRQGDIKKGERVGLLGIGSGLNCSMAELVW